MIKCFYISIFIILLAATRVAANSLDEAYKYSENGDFFNAVAVCKPLAEKGDAKAQLLMGLLLIMRAKEDKQKLVEAFDWIKKSAEQGLPDSQFLLGCFYEEGTAVKKDYEKAIFWYLKAGDAGLVKAQLKLGESYYFGLFTPQDYDHAHKWLKRAAKSGDLTATLLLGRMFYFGKGREKDIPKAFSLYRKIAGKIPEAQLILGIILWKGEGGIAKNKLEATKWIRMAAENGLIDAQVKLGLIYLDEYPDVAKEDASIGFRWMKKAFESGDDSATIFLGMLYYSGIGTEQNHSKALELIRKIAQKGNSQACLALGIFYEEGKAVPQDDHKALEWYKRAADLGEEMGKERFEELQRIIKEGGRKRNFDRIRQQVLLGKVNCYKPKVCHSMC